MSISVVKTFALTTLDDIEVNVTVEATFYKESGYGADADGNRGQDAYFLEEFTITDIDGIDHISKEIKSDLENKVSKELEDIDL